jgi:hypothetical protein
MSLLLHWNCRKFPTVFCHLQHATPELESASDRGLNLHAGGYAYDHFSRPHWLGAHPVTQPRSRLMFDCALRLSWTSARLIDGGGSTRHIADGSPVDNYLAQYYPCIPHTFFIGRKAAACSYLA